MEASLSDETLSALEDLKTILRKLEERMNGFEKDPQHFSAHLSMQGYILHLRDNARAVILLSPEPSTGMALWSNARGVFEAAQDFLLLVTSGSDFDLSGARVRIFERLERADWAAKYSEAFPEDGLGSRSEILDHVASHIRNDAERIGRYAPERGQELLTALDAGLLEFASRGRSHWYGNRSAIAIEVEKRLGVGAEGEGKRQIQSYSALSRHSHPRFRADGYHPDGDDVGIENALPSDSSRRSAILLTEQACALMWIGFNVFEGKPNLHGLDQFNFGIIAQIEDE